MNKKNYNLFISGTFITIFGTSIYNYFANLYIIEQTQNSVLYGYYRAIVALAILIMSYLMIKLSNKLDIKIGLILADTLQGIIFIVISILIKLELLSFNYYLILLISFIIQFINSFYMPMTKAIISTFKYDYRTNSKLNFSLINVERFAKLLAPFVVLIFYKKITNSNIIILYLMVNGLSYLITAFIETKLNVIDYKYEKKTHNNVKDTIKLINNSSLKYMFYISVIINISISSYMICLNFNGITLIGEHFYFILVIITFLSGFVAKKFANHYTLKFIHIYFLSFCSILLFFIPSIVTYGISLFIMFFAGTIFNVRFFTLIQQDFNSENVIKVTALSKLIDNVFFPVVSIMVGYLLDFNFPVLMLFITTPMMIVIFIEIFNHNLYNNINQDKGINK